MSVCRVFLSYAHESDDFREQVRALAAWLDTHGVEVLSDFAFEAKPPASGWTTWMQQSIEQADYVLVVCTPRLCARYEKREPPSIGIGATFEGALVTQTLYEASHHNSKFFPIVPDGGSSADIPLALRAFDNHHRFPSGNARILRLLGIADPEERPSPRIGRDSLPGLLRGATDNRLAPRSVRVAGRETEIGRVVEFLKSEEDSAVVCAHVTGSGGIGKTEVCKASLKLWLEGSPDRKAFYIDVPDQADAQLLIERIGDALGMRGTSDFDVVKRRLVPAVYYLDNLESIAELTEGRQVLRWLRDTPGVRILASSRVSLPADLGRSMTIDELPVDAAVQVFQDCWTGDAVPPDTSELREFLQEQLGCHALSVTLVARLGDSYSLSALVALWKTRGTSMPRDTFDGVTRHGSLSICLSLTAERLRHTPGALLLWTLCAVFEKGISERTVERFEAAAAIPPEARHRLVRHHIIRLQNGTFRLLPPIARYAVDEARQEQNAFSWKDARRYFDSYSRLPLEALHSDELASRQGMGVQAYLLEVDLAQATEAASARLEAMRRDFMANVTHEIRTPLTVLAGFIETLKNLPLSDAERSRVHRLMAQQADRMQALVGDLLMLARVQEQLSDREAPWIPLSQVLDGLKGDAVMLSDGRHKLTFPSECDLVIHLEGSLLYSAISNLIVNAIRYTPPGGDIELRLATQPAGGLEISVRDTGIGIASEHMPRLTERFYRIDSSRSRDTGGTGLGLAIANQIMRNCGGNLEMSSELGKGSTFTLVFPAEAVVVNRHA
jgi:signal transduction histidine kinase